MIAGMLGLTIFVFLGLVVLGREIRSGCELIADAIKTRQETEP